MLLGLAHFRVVDAARKPLAGIPVTVRWTLPLSKNEAETTVETGENGDAIIAVPPAQMPQLPVDAEYKAGSTTGKVKVGGNSHTPVTQIVVHAA